MKTLQLTEASATLLKFIVGTTAAQGLNVAMLTSIFSARAKLTAAGAKAPEKLIRMKDPVTAELALDGVITQPVEFDKDEWPVISAMFKQADVGHPMLRLECLEIHMMALIEAMKE